MVDTFRYGRLDNMRRHRFVASWVYEIPGPQSGVPGKVAGGWQVTGIYQWQSGEPMTIASGTRQRRLGTGQQPRNRDRASRTLRRPARARPCGSTRRRSPSTRTGRSARRKRGEYFGPRHSTVDLGLFKNFRLTNQMNMQFRAEFFNAFEQGRLPRSGKQRRIGGGIRADHQCGRCAHHAIRVEIRIQVGSWVRRVRQLVRFTHCERRPGCRSRTNLTNPLRPRTHEPTNHEPTKTTNLRTRPPEPEPTNPNPNLRTHDPEPCLSPFFMYQPATANVKLRLHFLDMSRKFSLNNA